MSGVTGGETLQLAEEMFISGTGGGGSHGGCFRWEGGGRTEAGCQQQPLAILFIIVIHHSP